MALKHRSELGAAAPSQASESGRAAKQGVERAVPQCLPAGPDAMCPARVPVSSS